MKILHVCFSDGLGGAFIGAYRLHSCMVATGLDSELLVIKKRTEDPGVIKVPRALRIRTILLKKLSRLLLYTQITPDNEYRSLNLFSTPIIKIINSHEADIVQLHWIGNNTIGIPDLGKIKKPLVWKLPDMWAFCGCEHYTHHERRYQDGYTSSNRPKDHYGLDLDRFCWEKKLKYWKNLDLTIVCPSKWLADCAKKSFLLKKYPVYNIPNPIDMNIFRPTGDVASARNHFNLPKDKRLILFSSMAKTSYLRKGYDYLDKCIREFSKNADKSLYSVVFMGREVPEKELYGIEVINLGFLWYTSDLVAAYSCMDATIVPSSADNLPNVIKESMACGTPCVSFETGGVPDMIVHKVNGYLAPVADYQELARGLEWIFSGDKSKIRENARESALQLHGHVKIVNQYNDLYEHILSGH